MTSQDRDPDDQGSRSSRIPTRTRPEKQKQKRLPLWAETIFLLTLALVLAIGIKALFVQAFYIPSESMEPGLVKNDRILVEKPSYWFGGPERGDVVVFKDPGGWLPAEEAATPTGVRGVLSKIGLYPAGGHLVKRVIGVAGDTIVCCDEQGRISVNEHPLDEDDYIQLVGPDADCAGPMPKGNSHCDWSVGPVPKGHVFVMGDNRDHSADSSYHACLDAPEGSVCDDDPYVDVHDVVGKVFVLPWPASRFTFLHRPDGFADVPDAS